MTEQEMLKRVSDALFSRLSAAGVGGVPYTQAVRSLVERQVEDVLDDLRRKGLVRHNPLFETEFDPATQRLNIQFFPVLEAIPVTFKVEPPDEERWVQCGLTQREFEMFCDYHADHGVWGSLHIVLEDLNVETHHVEYCVQYAAEHGDARGHALGKILLRLTEAQRALIADRT